MKRANVDRAVARAHIGSISTAAMTGETGAGAGLGVSCTVMCAATQSEQSACVTIWSACVCATCTTPANTTSTAHKTATAIFHERLERSGLARKSIPAPTIPESDPDSGRCCCLLSWTTKEDRSLLWRLNPSGLVGVSPGRPGFVGVPLPPPYFFRKVSGNKDLRAKYSNQAA